MSNTVNYPFEIDGVTMPDPSEITVTRNYLFAQKSGRMSSGTFSGDIIAKKWTLQVTWTNLSEEQAASISSVIDSKTWHSVKFRSPKDNAFITCTMYSSDLPFPVYSYAVPKAAYQSLTITLVEQ